MIVVDASAIIEVLLRTGRGAAVEQRCLTAAAGLHAPHLVDAEVVSAIRRLLLEREIDLARADLAVEIFGKMRLRRWSMVPLRARMWALRGNVSAYDASYVALAERLGCPLVTCDARLARSSGHDGDIELFGE